jgi:hypothetical protein
MGGTMPEYKPTYSRLHALVVAVDEYHSLSKLDNAVRGANAFAEALQTSYGFEVDKLLNDNATRENILRWFYGLRGKCDPDDGVLFYYAGHGLTERNPDGEAEAGYLALAYSEREIYDTALSMDEVIRRVNVLPSKHVLVLIDACFSGLILRPAHVRRGAEEESESKKKLIETLMKQPFRYAITAGGEEAVDDNLSPDGLYSLFTYCLLQGLQGAVWEKDKEIGDFVRAKVLANYLDSQITGNPLTRHQPRYGHLGQLTGGDFVFYIKDSGRLDSDLCTVIDPRKVLDTHSKYILQHLQRTAKLTVIDEISAGQSGSHSFLVDITGRPKSNLEGLHYCKIHRTPAGEEQEKYGQILETTIGEFIPRFVDHSPVMDKWTASLYSLAHGATLDLSQALANLLKRNMLAAVEGVKGLAELLHKWNPLPQDRQNSTAYSLLKLPLQRFMEGSNIVEVSISKRIEENIANFTPEDTQILYAGYPQVLPNPVAYLSSERLWTGARSIVWPSGHVHGDLHSNNIICRLDQKGETIVGVPAIVDFDTYSSGGCTLYDFAYLEIDLAMRMLDPISVDNRRIWPKVSEYLVRTIDLPAVPPLHPQYFPLHALLTPLRSAVSSICQQQPGDFEVAYWVSRTAAGLSFARKRKVSSSQRLLTLLIAAHSLQKALSELGIDYLTDERPFWMQWV